MSSELLLFTKKILIVCLFAVLGYALYLSRSFLVLFLVSGFLSLMFIPLVELAKKYRIPEWITIIFVYILLIFLVVIVIATIIPIISKFITSLIEEVTAWVNSLQSSYQESGVYGLHLPPFVESLILQSNFNINDVLTVLRENIGNIQKFVTDQLSSLTSGSISIVSSVGGFITDIAIIGITTFFIILERRPLWGAIINLLPQGAAHYVDKRFVDIKSVCTSWIKATLILGFAIFLLMFIGLSLVNMIFDLQLEGIFTLSIIAGLMEFIPYIGPILSAIPGIILGLGSSGLEGGFIVAIVYIIIQELENNLLVPYIMSANFDLSPLFVLVIMLVAGSMWGVLGMVLAVPIGGIIKIFYDDYVASKKKALTPKQDNTGEKKISPRKRVV